jgi:hypothetical protein
MTSDGQSIERLREYLRALKPEARSLLVEELERYLLRDNENAGNELVFQELRRASCYSELTAYLETGTKVLLDSPRIAGDADLPFRQSQMEPAIRFCRIVFGGEYAGLLSKAAEVAVHSMVIERKPLRA